MKTLVTNYTFLASTKQITFTDYPSLVLDQILLITNVTDNAIVYNFADPTAGGTLAGNVLTLLYDTTSMSDSDRLQIFIDDYTVPATEASLTAVQVKIDNTNILLNALTAKQETFNLDISAVNVNTDELEGLIRTVNQNVSATNTRLTNIDTDLDTTNSRLQTLIDQTDGIEGSIDQVETKLDNIKNDVVFLRPSAWDRTTTQLTSSINLIQDIYILNIQGTSYAGYDQYLQIYDAANTPLNDFSQLIKAGENFNIEFPKGFYGESVTIRNSLTPWSYTPGNNDIVMTISWVRA